MRGKALKTRTDAAIGGRAKFRTAPQVLLSTCTADTHDPNFTRPQET